MSAGKTYDSIARTLHLSTATIAYHVSKLENLLRVPNGTALVAFCIAAGILNAESWPILPSGRLHVVGDCLEFST
jgi:hypothetical protein